MPGTELVSGIFVSLHASLHLIKWYISSNNLKQSMKTQKELKEAYKNMKFDMGVFQIKNNVNGKILIGSSLDLKAFWNAQKLQLEIGMHRNAALQKEWNEFGAANFSYEILGLVEHSENPSVDYQKEVKIMEELFIDELQPFDNKGYNQKQKL